MVYGTQSVIYDHKIQATIQRALRRVLTSALEILIVLRGRASKGVFFVAVAPRRVERQMMNYIIIDQVKHCK